METGNSYLNKNIIGIPLISWHEIRVSYYARPRIVGANPTIAEFKAGLVRYLKQMGNYLLHLNDRRVHTIDPVPIFRDAITSILTATEDALGFELNSTYRHYGQDTPEQKYLAAIAAPWELNYTFSNALSLVLEDTGLYCYELTGGPFRIFAWPRVEWCDHAKDETDYRGEEGVVMAFEQARAMVEMKPFIPSVPVVYDPEAWPEEESMGKSLIEITPPPETRMKWCPWQWGALELPCMTWSECWQDFVFHDGPGVNWHRQEYWRWYFGLD